MVTRVQFADEIEPLVQFIEETAPYEILEHTLAKLRAGVPIKTMLTASALAVTRSSDLPPGHHGGPLHPLAGLHAVAHLTERLAGEDQFLPVLQHVGLANKHIHHPSTGPYMLPDFEPIDAGGVEATREAFFSAVNRGVYNMADHYFLWLWDHMPPVAALDTLLTVAIPKNVLDDHYFIFPAFTWRAVEYLGQEHLATLMRPAVRYVSRFPTPPALPEIEDILEEYALLTRPIVQSSVDDDPAVIGRLGEAIGVCRVFADIPRMLAQALVDGLSLEGAGEALSIGAAGLFLRSLTGNPMDVHLHTSINLRRYLLRLDGLSLRNKLLILLLWHTGPEIRSTERRMEAVPQPDMAAVAALPYRTQDELLEAITENIYQQPPIDWATVINLGQLRAMPEVKIPVQLAQQYVNYGYDATALIARLAEIVCHDNFTEMHAFKHHQAIVEEFAATRAPWRTAHLVAGVQAAAISFGKDMSLYEEALELLHA
ncbi:MAG: hypothetical protein FJZ47_11985 [Candidatus Tectomicrobia bacterium]|uniref:Uncharacterized protein n=1 Tax=Tectimicrobiota bacterium TaxID=2528274 RepID=A0A938B4B4_UNCTE|nr:hypothetical protein [Candidatus Tectomicrobia bacterium]